MTFRGTFSRWLLSLRGMYLDCVPLPLCSCTGIRPRIPSLAGDTLDSFAFPGSRLTPVLGNAAVIATFLGCGGSTVPARLRSGAPFARIPTGFVMVENVAGHVESGCGVPHLDECGEEFILGCWSAEEDFSSRCGEFGFV